jgi:hypothetical protein
MRTSLLAIAAIVGDVDPKEAIRLVQLWRAVGRRVKGEQAALLAEIRDLFERSGELGR